MTSAPKRNKMQKERDRGIIADLLLESYTYRQIVKHLNQITATDGYSLSIAQVHYDSKNILSQWTEMRKDIINDIVQRELAKIDFMEFEAWQAWKESKSPKSKTKTRGGTLVNGQLMSSDNGGVERTVEKSNGDPRFLLIVQNCWDKRKNLLGYGAAPKIEHTGTVGVTIANLDKDEMEKERDRMLSNMLKKRGIISQN